MERSGGAAALFARASVCLEAQKHCRQGARQRRIRNARVTVLAFCASQVELGRLDVHATDRLKRLAVRVSLCVNDSKVLIQLPHQSGWACVSLCVVCTCGCMCNA